MGKGRTLSTLKWYIVKLPNSYEITLLRSMGTTIFSPIQLNKVKLLIQYSLPNKTTTLLLKVYTSKRFGRNGMVNPFLQEWNRIIPFLQE